MLHSVGPRLTILALALLVVGCGSSDGIARVPVSGTVTLDDQPVEQGQITFMPQDGDNVASATIKSGRYNLNRSDGPSPGPHRVTIWSRVPTGKQIVGDDLMPDELVDEYRESIPEQYNAQTTLTADIQQDGSNTFDFPLKSEATP